MQEHILCQITVSKIYPAAWDMRRSFIKTEATKLIQYNMIKTRSHISEMQAQINEGCNVCVIQ